MAKLFYDHMLIYEEIMIILDTHTLSKKDKEDIIAKIDEIMHIELIDVILTHLPKQHHDAFLHKLSSHPHDPAILTYINEKSGKNVERLLLKKASAVKKKVLKHIEESGNI